jgi:hypothetical protein
MRAPPFGVRTRTVLPFRTGQPRPSRRTCRRRIGVAARRETADVLDDHYVDRARAAGWTWAEIAAVLEVSPEAAHKRHARRHGPESSNGTTELGMSFS